jgi:hypothetical protein
VFYSNTLEINHPNEIYGRQALSSNLEGFKEIKSSKTAQHLKDDCEEEFVFKHLKPNRSNCPLTMYMGGQQIYPQTASK